MILFEDDHLLVADKPAGMVVHPTYKNVSGTLLDVLRANGHWTDDQNPSIVGRLDRLTSGLVVAAKSPASHAALQAVMTSGDCEKLYLAIVDGPVHVPSGVIDFPLAVNPADRRRVVVSDSGAACRTEFKRIGDPGAVTLLQCRLLTGRRHQIRVHLAASGWPIVGDAVYGAERPGMLRHALHSWRLRLVHPFTGHQHQWEAAVPEEMGQLIQDARKV